MHMAVIPLPLRRPAESKGSVALVFSDLLEKNHSKLLNRTDVCI